MFHQFATDITGIELPSKFNDPFRYRPHRLAIIAADELRSYIASDTHLQKEVSQGKMFGVLVVRDTAGRIGYLAAYSGLLAGSNMQPFFVPAVYDMLQPGGYFKQEEAAISQINREIDALLHSEAYRNALDAAEMCRLQAEREISAMRKEVHDAKMRRDAMRLSTALSAEEEAALLHDSRHRKAELRRLSKRLQAEILECEKAVDDIEKQILSLKEERKSRSASLQRWLFGRFVMLNAQGESSTLLQIFDEHSGCLPPAGAGECAAPKMLQYAYANGMQPLCMAEFWIGASPMGEVRRDGCYYPSCKGKCGPILGFMLRGLPVESLPFAGDAGSMQPSSIVYEDDSLLIVNKPSGVLSVPGIVGGCSVQEWLSGYNPATRFYVVHRLDMATSGLLVVAKSMDVCKALQAQFAERKVSKMYVALLDGLPARSEGEINLPLSPDYINRPCQKVDFEQGKEAVTHYKVVTEKMYKGRMCAVVELYPVTGRTHQLRVHCAHALGLNRPIVGDELYGTQADRLMLHAARILFRHPVTGKDIIKEVAADF